MIGCEDRLRNYLYCVEWGVKLYSNQPTNGRVGSFTRRCTSVTLNAPHYVCDVHACKTRTFRLIFRHYTVTRQRFLSITETDEIHKRARPSHTEQKAQLSPRDRAMRRVSRNLTNCHAIATLSCGFNFQHGVSVQKLHVGAYDKS